jgi:hypothetical protein
MIEGPNSGYSSWAYIIDKEYSENPIHYIRAFLIIQNDLKELFEFIEPSEINLKTYSFRIHQLLLRTCIEIESNFKAILRENIYTPVYKRGKRKGDPRKENRWNINDYKIINKTHHLSSYQVIIPFWNNPKKTFTPFNSWEKSKSPEWYQAYNKSKHNRMNYFKEANLENLLMAVSGLLILLSSQFKTESFLPGSKSIGLGQSYSYYNGEFGIGSFFMVKFPDDWKDEEKYKFNWSELKKEEERFQKIDYNRLSP